MNEFKDGFAVELDNLRESGKAFLASSEKIEIVRNFQLGSAINTVRQSTEGGTENPFEDVASGFEKSYDALVGKLVKMRDATDSLGEAVSAIAQRYENQG